MANALSWSKRFALLELIYKVFFDEKLWVRSAEHESSLNLREDVYWKALYNSSTRPLNCSEHVMEASRESAIVRMGLDELLDIFVEMDKWSEVFCGIVSRVLSCTRLVERNDEASLFDSLQMIRTENQLPSPLVPPREFEYIRYCHMIAEGLWCVVDFTLNWFGSHPLPNAFKRPSGCLIKKISNEHCLVTWVEHVQVAGEVVHDMYKPLFQSGLAYGAGRWLAALKHHCQRLPTAVATLNHELRPEGTRSFLTLTGRLMKGYCSTFGSSGLGRSWRQCPMTPIVVDGVELKMKQNFNDPQIPPGVILSCSMSIFLQVSYKLAFDFLRNLDYRNQWDILCNHHNPEELMHIPTGSDPGNYASILSVDAEDQLFQNKLIVQESRIDSIGCYLVYAPFFNCSALQHVVQGQDSTSAAALPSGFAIFPARRRAQSGGVVIGGGDGQFAGGCLMTIAFQILLDTNPAFVVSRESLITIKNIVRGTARMIKNELLSGE